MKSAKDRYIVVYVLGNILRRTAQISSTAALSNIIMSVKNTRMRRSSSQLALLRMTDMEDKSSCTTKAIADTLTTPPTTTETTTDATPLKKGMITSASVEMVDHITIIIIATRIMVTIIKRDIRIGAQIGNIIRIFSLEDEILITIKITAISSKKLEMEIKKVTIITGPIWTTNI